MRVKVVAIGRLRKGPEFDLIQDYTQRFDKIGRNMGLGPVSFQELEDKKQGGKASEGALLLAAIPQGAVVCALDERGALFTSPEFSNKIAKARDDGTSDLIFVIGGADGLAQAVLDRADFKLSFGKMVWPHMLARVMLSEQLYRAASILSGSPYHRV